MLLTTVAPLFFSCFPNNVTHIAWVTERRDAQGVHWLDVERWTQGDPPLPASIRLGVHRIGPPPPPVRLLATLRRDANAWKLLWSWPETSAAEVEETIAKIAVGGSILKGRIDGVPEPIPEFTIHISGVSVSRGAVARDGMFEVLGLAPGHYEVTAEATGYRQVAPIGVDLDKCTQGVLPVERYGLREWALEKSFPLRSMAMAAWSLAREMLGGAR